MPVWMGCGLITMMFSCFPFFLVHMIDAHVGSPAPDTSTGRIYAVAVGGKYRSATVFVDRNHFLAYWITEVPVIVICAIAIIGGIVSVFVGIRRRHRS